MVLGEMVAADAKAVVGLNELQAVLVVGAEGRRAEVEMVEDADLHGPCSLTGADYPAIRAFFQYVRAPAAEQRLFRGARRAGRRRRG